ncbi:hypothetical protein BH09PAT2_BH09PAT2_01480 [soil metagenome]
MLTFIYTFSCANRIDLRIHKCRLLITHIYGELLDPKKNEQITQLRKNKLKYKNYGYKIFKTNL